VMFHRYKEKTEKELQTAVRLQAAARGFLARRQVQSLRGEKHLVVASVVRGRRGLVLHGRHVELQRVDVRAECPQISEDVGNGGLGHGCGGGWGRWWRWRLLGVVGAGG
jgi:hypothetical protein